MAYQPVGSDDVLDRTHQQLGTHIDTNTSSSNAFDRTGFSEPIRPAEQLFTLAGERLFSLSDPVSSTTEPESDFRESARDTIFSQRSTIVNHSRHVSTNFLTDSLISEKKGLAIKAKPRNLNPHTSAKLFGLFAESLLCLLPISFLALAATANSLDGHQVSDFGGEQSRPSSNCNTYRLGDWKNTDFVSLENVRQWSLLSPTLFPVIFAAVLGRSLRNIAHFVLERGVTVMVSISIYKGHSTLTQKSILNNLLEVNLCSVQLPRMPHCATSI